MQHVSHLTIHGIASALTRRRRISVNQIVRNVFEAQCGEPLPPGRVGRRTHIDLRQIGIWAAHESTWTDDEISREYGVSVPYIMSAIGRVESRRADPSYSKLTDAVLAELEA